MYIIGIMMGCRSSDYCRKLFYNLEILPLLSQYILSLLLCVIRNRNQLLGISEIYHIDTRQHTDSHQPAMYLTKYQKEVHYLGVKVFKMLPLI
jgi:hypothetical protein